MMSVQRAYEKSAPEKVTGQMCPLCGRLRLTLYFEPRETQPRGFNCLACHVKGFFVGNEMFQVNPRVLTFMLKKVSEDFNRGFQSRF